MPVLTEATAEKLLESMSALVEQTSILIENVADVSKQLNKHTNYIVAHEREIMRHRLCENFAPRRSRSSD